MARYRLPAPVVAPASGRGSRLRTFLPGTWAGRILLAALGVCLLRLVGLPLPGLLVGLDNAVLVGFAAWACFRVTRYVLRRLLWRIRTKLIVSYLFIAVVPMVLLAVLFLLAGLFSLTLVASYVVSSQIERAAQELKTSAQAAIAGLNLDDPHLPALLSRRLDPARSVHPRVSYALVRKGKVLAESGSLPHELPDWLKSVSFGGLVKSGAREVLRVVWTEGDAFLVLDAPFDDPLLSGIEQRTGIHVMPGFRIETQADRNRRAPDSAAPGPGDANPDPDVDLNVKLTGAGAGWNSLAVTDRTDWATGRLDLNPLQIRFQPYGLLRQLSPASKDIGDALLVRGLTIVGALFLVVYVFALGLGLLLARSITTNIHALSLGTERLRRGDFDHPIAIHSRDQLGELGESFNMMGHDIKNLLREQAEKQRLEEELRIARQIQMSLLPQGAVTLPGLRIAALCLPAEEVGGDYYDLLPLSETRMGVLVADVSGKGTSAALYMAELKGLVLSLSRIYESPAKLLGEANRILSANMDARSFITMTYAVVDTAARTMRYARAGHNPIIHLEAKTGLTRVLTPAGLGLGIDRGTRFEEILEEAETPLESGDLFLFFTDGLSEAMNVRAELFGERRLRDLLEKWESLSSEEMKQQILAEIKTFVGEAAQHDDMTMVILKVV